MKKFLITLFVSVMFITSAGAIDVYVNCQKLESDVPAQIINGRTMVPLRPIFESLDATVSWDNSTRTATGIKDGTRVDIQIDNTTAYVNGVPIALDVPAKIIDGHTMVPAAFVSQSLGAKVYWDDTTSTVRITTNLHDVVRVIDGDTIVVDYNGAEETVRLIGVDTPESVHPIASKNTEAGVAASEFTKFYLNDQKVELEFDVRERDQYGRLLAYVYCDGKMFNEKLLRTGYASIATYPPNVKYVDKFADIVKNRDSSIPTGKYLGGYMQAPKIIYSVGPKTTGMDYSLLYVTGEIEYIDVSEGLHYCTLKTEEGYVTLTNSYNVDDFQSLKKGDTVSVGFVYLLTEDNMAGGVYTTTLERFEDPQKTNPSSGTNTSSGTTNPSSGTNTSSGTTNPSESTKTTVYITKTGKKYHYSSTCNGGKYYPSTLGEARSRGLTPCSKCVH